MKIITVDDEVILVDGATVKAPDAGPTVAQDSTTKVLTIS